MQSKNSVSNRMKGPVSAAMSQPRRQPANAAQAQLDPNWQRKMGSANRYQPSSTFLPRQGSAGQNSPGSGKMSSGIGNTNRRATNAFDAKAFLRSQRPGEYLHASQNAGEFQQDQQQQQQYQPTHQQRNMQQQQRQNVGGNGANFDIQAFKRSAPRLQQNAPQQMQPEQQQQVQQQPVQQQRVQQQPVQQTQPVQQQRVQPQQPVVQQQSQVPRQQQRFLPVQQAVQQPRAVPMQTTQQPQQNAKQIARPIARTVPQQTFPEEQASNNDDDNDYDDKLPWQAASQNVASRIQKGASSKDVLQKIAEMRQNTAIEPIAPAAAEQQQEVGDELNGAATDEAPRIY